MKLSKSRTRNMLILGLLVLIMALPGLNGLPVIDRDEARYAQASVQMMESGDYVNIRFQDTARNKKPAGAYWLQTMSVKAFSNVENRDIWAHRIPSVLAALLAVWATYLGGIRMVGRESAFIGSALLATSMIFVFEAHIAKTDALLCACAAICLASIGYLREGGGRKSAIVFWGAMGCAVMIKGPILPLLVGLCLLSLWAWERKASWLKPLGYWFGPLLFLVIILPWGILIWRETGGEFFTQALGEDLAPKLKGGHERHGGAPGYYALTTWLAFWPACLFLLPGLAFAVKTGRNKDTFESTNARTSRLLLCWGIPMFIVLELIPTKLPHYPLPLYPAWALMVGMALVNFSPSTAFTMWRRIGAGLFLVFSLALIIALVGAEYYYGETPSGPVSMFIIMGLAAILCIYAAMKYWQGHNLASVKFAIFAAILVTICSYQFTLPALQSMHISKRVQTALLDKNIDLTHTQILSTQFTEPSLVFHLGTHIMLGKQKERLNELSSGLLGTGDIIILDRVRTETTAFEAKLQTILQVQNLCLLRLDVIDGFNYAKGDAVRLDLLRLIPCKIQP